MLIKYEMILTDLIIIKSETNHIILYFSFKLKRSINLRIHPLLALKHGSSEQLRANYWILSIIKTWPDSKFEV